MTLSSGFRNQIQSAPNNYAPRDREKRFSIPVTNSRHARRAQARNFLILLLADGTDMG